MSVYDGAGAETRKVFISYSSIDRVRTQGLGLLLEAMGHQVFHDHRTIKPGMKWKAALQDGLDGADIVMVFWTRHAARSDWVRKEYEYFLANYPERPLVPVLGDETPLTDLLKTRQQADFAPVVNEVLELKRRMKDEGASAGQIERAVVQRLDDAGVEIPDKRQRRLLFLFLGFGWLLTLLRRPGAAIESAGRGVVEKTAQLSLGQATAMAAAVLIGIVGGALGAERLSEPDANARPPAAGPSLAMPGDPAPGADREGSTERVDSVETMTFSSGLSEVYSEIIRSRVDITDRLSEISGRLDEAIDGGGDALALCRADVRALNETVAALRGAMAEGPADTAATGVVEPPAEPPPLPEGTSFGFEPPDGEGEFTSPRLLAAPRPDYPQQAIDRGYQGDVVIYAVVDTQGDVSVYADSGLSVFTEAARRAVSRWKFTPGTRDGVPWERRFWVKIEFILKD